MNRWTSWIGVLSIAGAWTGCAGRVETADMTSKPEAAVDGGGGDTDDPAEPEPSDATTDDGTGLTPTPNNPSSPDDAPSGDPGPVSSEPDPDEPMPSEPGPVTPTGGPAPSAPVSPEPGPTLTECDVDSLSALMVADCGGGGCHSESDAAASLDLVSTGFDARVVDIDSASCADWALVVPGSPERSFLYQKVASTAPPCGLSMPVGEAWPRDAVSCLADWIRSLSGDVPVEQCETCGTTLCIDIASDAQHCGACDIACVAGEVCREGQCTGCATGESPCDGVCAQTDSDPLNCGGCGVVCGGGQVCETGQCVCGASASLSYAADVQPIFDATCGGNACHAGRRPAEGLDLLSGGAYRALIDGTSAQCTDRALVAPGAPGESYLMDKLLGVRMCGGTVMPKGAFNLTQSEIDLVGSWICGGANP